MNAVYTDARNAAETLRNQLDDAEEGDEGEVVFMRDSAANLAGLTDEEMEERNIWSMLERVDDQICSIRWRRGALGHSDLSLFIHQSSITEPLTLEPAPRDAIGVKNQATHPTELSHALSSALSPLLEAVDITFDLSKVNAASIAHGGHLTDYEVTYDMMLMSSL